MGQQALSAELPAPGAAIRVLVLGTGLVRHSVLQVHSLLEPGRRWLVDVFACRRTASIVGSHADRHRGIRRPRSEFTFG